MIYFRNFQTGQKQWYFGSRITIRIARHKIAMYLFPIKSQITTNYRLWWFILSYFIFKRKTKVLNLSSYLQVQHGYKQVHAMPCSASLQTMKMVDRCPRNSLEWDARAALFNCSSIKQSCVSTDMFLYHCVLNTYGTELIEICAVYKFIYGS